MPLDITTCQFYQRNQFILWRNICSQGIECVIQKQEGGAGIPTKTFRAVPLVFVEMTSESMALSPISTTRLSMEDAQEIMNQLWSCGIRPAEGAGSAGQLAATQEHLADMRKMTQQLLGSVLKCP